MSVKISTSTKDELNVVSIKYGHPLKTIYELKDKTDDDVVYICIPLEMMKEMICLCESATEREGDFHVLFTGDIKLRHNFDTDTIK